MGQATEETTLLVKTGENKRGSVTAREAFEGADATASRAYHEDKIKGASTEAHQTEGGLLKPVIFGGLDGILTSFAIVAGSAGGNLSPNVVLVLGFSNIFADALSMGVGEFLSSKANNEWILSERARENWEMENYPEGRFKDIFYLFVALTAASGSFFGLVRAKLGRKCTWVWLDPIDYGVSDIIDGSYLF